MKRIAAFIKREMILCIAGLLAVISLFFVPPDRQYLQYVDYQVLALLFCLMTVMEGFKCTGLFEKMAMALLCRVHTFRQLYLVLVLLCFFSSMWITNDVALLTFVPFALLVLKVAGLQREVIPVILMQTIAANLGSMATPVGNPQNLYLYSSAGMDLAEFVRILGPLTIVSLLMILAACLCHRSYPLQQETLKNMVEERKGAGQNQTGVSGYNRKMLWENLVLAALFICCLLSVLRILSWQWMLGGTVIVCILFSVFGKEKFLPRKVDYYLLLTFVAFFIFIGNMGRIPAVRAWISRILDGRELLVSFGCSQVLSNVPAAILLEGFTDRYDLLLRGVNIGGMGTLIASMASLISYKLFAAESDREPAVGTKGNYILKFTGYSAVMAAVLLLAAQFI